MKMGDMAMIVCNQCLSDNGKKPEHDEYAVRVCITVFSECSHPSIVNCSSSHHFVGEVVTTFHSVRKIFSFCIMGKQTQLRVGFIALTMVP